MAEGNAEDAAVHLRGEPDHPGDVILRRFPEVLGGQMLSGDEINHSGRRQLAQWITAPDNPRTARVMVNRVWQHHFGSGLVKTPNDFGVRGIPPTHPELLDWLASRFIEDGWSIKHLHRTIMLSRTYQLSSSVHDRDQEQRSDPDNERYWRFNRQRLDAESLRDTLLLLSGDLDLEMPRQPHPFPGSEKWEYTQHHPFRDSYDSNKRSVYLMMARLNARPFFTTFDGADPNASTSSRDSSVTAVQSLYLLNGEFLQQQADKLAARILMLSDDHDQRISAAFELMVGRPPLDSEYQSVTQWMREMDGRLHESEESSDVREHETWTAFIRSILRTNEFLYVD